MCSCRCESLGPAALFGFSFPRACLLSSLKTSCALKPSQQLVTCSQVTSLVLEVLHGWNLILYVNRVPACLQQRESNVCCSHKCPGFPPWKPKLMQSWDYLAGLLSGFIKLLESAEMRLCSFGISVKSVSNVSCSSCLGIGFDFRSSCETFGLLLCSQNTTHADKK